MAQSIGVETKMVVLSHGKNDNYSEKWINALSRDIAYIPEVKSITKRISENKSHSNTTIISLLSQIAAVIGSRHQHRIVFPPVVLMNLLTNHVGEFNDSKASTIDFAGKRELSQHIKIWVMGKTNTKYQKVILYREIIYH